MISIKMILRGIIQRTISFINNVIYTIASFLFGTGKEINEFKNYYS